MRTKQTIRRPFAGIVAMSLVLTMACKPGGETKSDDTNVDPPKQIISKDRAANLFKEYTRDRVPYILSAQDTAEQKDFIPARYTEFDYDVIKQYIDYIEQEAAAANKEIETLRIYYAVYPPGTGSKSKKSTVFLVPSADFEGKNRAFEVRQEEESTEAVAIPWDFGTGVQQMGMQMQQDQRQYATFGPAPASAETLTVQGNRSLVLNDGNTSPPPYN